MRTVELDRLRRRIERAYAEVCSAEGPRPGMKWIIAGEDGSFRAVHYRDIKRPVEWEDQIHNLIHWIAVFKDHLSERAKLMGIDSGGVNERIRQDANLCICIDLDNTEKHVEITHGKGGKVGWSGLKPRIKEVRVSFPMASPEHPELREQGLVMMQPGSTIHSKIDMHKMEFKFSQPHLVQVYAPVLGEVGNDMGDACEIAQRAIEGWETIMTSMGIASASEQAM